MIGAAVRRLLAAITCRMPHRRATVGHAIRLELNVACCMLHTRTLESEYSSRTRVCDSSTHSCLGLRGFRFVGSVCDADGRSDPDAQGGAELSGTIATSCRQQYSVDNKRSGSDRFSVYLSICPSIVLWNTCAHTHRYTHARTRTGTHMRAHACIYALSRLVGGKGRDHCGHLKSNVNAVMCGETKG